MTTTIETSRSSSFILGEAREPSLKKAILIAEDSDIPIMQIFNQLKPLLKCNYLLVFSKTGDEMVSFLRGQTREISVAEFFSDDLKKVLREKRILPIENLQIEALITDNEMPPGELRGTDVIKIIRENQGIRVPSNLPIILQSANAREVLEQDLQPLVFDKERLDFLPKTRLMNLVSMPLFQSLLSDECKLTLMKRKPAAVSHSRTPSIRDSIDESIKSVTPPPGLFPAMSPIIMHPRAQSVANVPRASIEKSLEEELLASALSNSLMLEQSQSSTASSAPPPTINPSSSSS